VLYDNFSYIGKTRTTCVPTLLTGGHADNALPQMARVTLSCRIFPGMSVEEVQARLQRLVGPKVEVHAANAGVVSSASPVNAALMQVIATQVHAIYPGIPIVPEQASYATDGAVFRHAGIPTYGTQASFFKESEHLTHGLNELLPVASLYEGEALWYGLMRELAGPH
jgi:acetylornithine deacetylase/succinyl-diaminopimelate desuccinylase-like protein